MFWLGHDELLAMYESWSKEHQQWFNNLLDPNSAARQRMNEIIKTLKTQVKE